MCNNYVGDNARTSERHGNVLPEEILGHNLEVETISIETACSVLCEESCFKSVFDCTGTGSQIR